MIRVLSGADCTWPSTVLLAPVPVPKLTSSRSIAEAKASAAWVTGSSLRALTELNGSSRPPSTMSAVTSAW